MIDKEKIKFKQLIYYTPDWNGVLNIRIIKMINKGQVLVGVKSGRTFVRELEFIFEEENQAKNRRRPWESAQRRRKKKKK